MKAAQLRLYGMMVSKILFGGALFAAVALAQNIAGSWQGTLQPPQRELRIVMKIEGASDEALKATFYSIDQNGRGAPASVTLRGSAFKATIPAIGASYEGKLSADGSTISGTFTQNTSLPLNLVKATPTTAWAIPEPPPPTRQMDADAKPVFEVATIKPSNPESSGRGINVGRGGGNAFTTLNVPLADLIRFAFGLHARQVIGGPSWMETEKYDILAKPDAPGVPNAPQVRAMVQKLLAERFGLVFHREKRELSTYLLTVDKAGVKMVKSEASGSRLPGFSGRGPGRLGARNSTMADFADFLQARAVDRPVVDQTGLTDRYDFTLEFREERSGAAAVAGSNATPSAQPADDRPDLFAALRQQLGLRLESGKAQVEVLVIDKITKPTEN